MDLPTPIPLDLHTHRPPALAGQAMVSVRPPEFVPQPGACYSVGIHPWYPLDAQGEWTPLLQHPQVWAIGEAGLDKRCPTDWELQQTLLRQQIAWSERLCKPLILHLVGATEEILALRRTLRPRQAWVVHGFRGKAQLAESYLRQGFYLSFGSRFQEAALLATPLDRLFLETDESSEPIGNLYGRVAGLRGLSLSQLTAATQANFRRICPSPTKSF